MKMQSIVIYCDDVRVLQTFYDVAKYQFIVHRTSVVTEVHNKCREGGHYAIIIIDTGDTHVFDVLEKVKADSLIADIPVFYFWDRPPYYLLDRSVKHFRYGIGTEGDVKRAINDIDSHIIERPKKTFWLHRFLGALRMPIKKIRSQL
jgi:hypothetical protein